jgi:hypothetical protein
MARRFVTTLKIARQLAGFKSARAAALAYSWPESAYAAHEAGTRWPSAEQMARYMETFAVDPARLRQAESFGVPPAVAKTQEKRRRARRLVLARQLAGFATAKLAANTYDFNEQNYYAHESGRHGISDQLAAVYGLAFAVSPRWLLHGDGPSGITTQSGAEMPSALVEAFVASSDAQVADDLMRFASAGRRAAPEAVMALRAKKRRATSLPTATSVDGDALEVVREGVDGNKTNAWGFPSGFLSRVWGIASANLCVLALADGHEAGAAGLGDRILIDADDVAPVTGSVMAVRRGDGAVHLWTCPAGDADPGGSDLLGRVLARISRVLER